MAIISTTDLVYGNGCIYLLLLDSRATHCNGKLTEFRVEQMVDALEIIHFYFLFISPTDFFSSHLLKSQIVEFFLSGHLVFSS